MRAYQRTGFVDYPGLQYSTNATRYVIGQPLNIVRMYEYTGIDFNTGLYTFRDVNKDGVYNIDDRIHVGKLGTFFSAGLGNQFTYRNWSLDFFFQYVEQNKRFITYYVTLPGYPNNLPKEFTDLSVPGVKIGKYQRATSNGNPAATNAHNLAYNSTLGPTKANYAKLRNASLSL